MNALLNRSGAAQVVGMVTAAAGIFVLFVVGVVTAPVPVGTIILLTTALVVAIAPRRWAPVVGLAVTLYLVVGFVLNDTASQLSDPDGAGELVGTLALAVGLLLALVAGAVASARSYRRVAS